MDNKQSKVRSWIFQAWKNAEREKMSNNKKTNLSWRHTLAIRGCFLTLCLFFIMQSQQFFLLLWWNSHNGRYWLLYFLSVYPPLAFVIAEQEDMLGGGNAEPAEFEHFLSNNWKSLLVGGCFQGAGRLVQSARSPGPLRVCERWAVLLELCGHRG